MPLPAGNEVVEPPPYGIIWREFREGNIVPFLGAGASLGPRAGDATEFDGAEPRFLPRGDELAGWLASECGFPEKPDGDLAKVASYFQVRSGRELLVDYLRTIFRPKYPFRPVHELLADMLKPMLIITTNYDTLIEQAFEKRGKPYHLVTYPDSTELAAAVLWWKPGETQPVPYPPSQLPLKLEETTIIFKMHGSVLEREQEKEFEGFVITEEDYVHFLSRMTGKGGGIPSTFMLQLRNSSLLFLGYGLRDWNFRVMLEKLRRTSAPGEEGADGSDDLLPVRRAGAKPAWAIQRSPSILEKTLWQKRNVQIFTQGLDDFVQALRVKMDS